MQMEADLEGIAGGTGYESDESGEESLQSAKDAGTDSTHDDTGDQDASHNGKNTGLEVHIENAGSQCSGPCACSGQRYGNEEEKCREETAAGLGFKLSAAGFSLDQAPGEELSDHPLILAPYEQFAGEEVYERNGEHIAEDADDIRVKKRQLHCLRVGDGTAEFYKREH